MKLNATTLILFGILGLVGWMILKGDSPLLGSGTGGSSPGSNTLGGTTSTEQPDVFQSIVSAVNSIFGAVGAIAQTQASQH